MITSIQLPRWLDNLIFDQLGARYCRSNSDMTVIDWDKNDVLNYLGTYFPRSYAEAYCIFSEFFRLQPSRYASRKELTIFDFGCGTGGEIIGLLCILLERMPRLERIKIFALDGNEHALRLYQSVLSELKKVIPTQILIENHPAHVRIDDFYDLSILEKVLHEKFDIIISFKAICEFVTKQQFEKENPYEHISKVLVPKLQENGVLVFADVTSFNDVSQEWLPKMMDCGLANAKCKILHRNEGYNQPYIVSHSRCRSDISKISWRLITNDL